MFVATISEAELLMQIDDIAVKLGMECVVVSQNVVVLELLVLQQMIVGDPRHSVQSSSASS